MHSCETSKTNVSPSSYGLRNTIRTEKEKTRHETTTTRHDNHMASTGPGIRPVTNETTAHACRYTQQGKRLTYKLNVLQQPQRARACGSGQKCSSLHPSAPLILTTTASADRRPVDPPPIVELNIYEGENDHDLRDVTFSMTANYFLYVTLQQARHIAPGRQPNPPDRSATVLTGTPVAGMVYLDRPAPAGYFIFPDLSVRHEGEYRLSFSLYEEIKDPQDQDRDPAPGLPSHHSPGDSYVTHRLEVTSETFTVWSAKKFPGLTESTPLSRTVADQGCRVRIRRDVRMRRRDNKPSPYGWDTFEDETAAARARARTSGTPDPATFPTAAASGAAGPPPPPPTYSDALARSRSASNTSHATAGPVVAPRRSSAHEADPVTAAYAHPPPSTYPASPSPFASTSQCPSQYASSSQYPSAPQYAPTYSHVPTPSPSAYYYDSSSYGPSLPWQNQYTSTPSTAYDSSSRMSVDYSRMPSAPRRSTSSAQYQPPPPPPPPLHAGYAATPQSSHPSSRPAYTRSRQSSSSGIAIDPAYTSRPETLQPLLRGAPGVCTTPVSSSSTRPFPDSVPQFDAQMSSRPAVEPVSPASSAPAPPSMTPQPADSHKRVYAQVFSEAHHHQSLRHGARPGAATATCIPPPPPPPPPYSAAMYGGTAPLCSTASSTAASPASIDDDDTDTDIEVRREQMKYRRADGSQVARKLPAPS